MCTFHIKDLFSAFRKNWGVVLRCLSCISSFLGTLNQIIHLLLRHILGWPALGPETTASCDKCLDQKVWAKKELGNAQKYTSPYEFIANNFKLNGEN